MSLVEDLMHEMQELRSANEELQQKTKEMTTAVSDFIHEAYSALEIQERSTKMTMSVCFFVCARA